MRVVVRYILTYTYTDANSCTASATQTIVVNPLPTVSFSVLSPICVDGLAITLSQGSPAGGTYSGAGVSGGQFTPSVAGVGTHIDRKSVVEGKRWGAGGTETSV